ncbi:MAG: phage Gp37/Gp68 family protein [Candidatus Eisenbacteria bacterium]|nr:phage Gp37/Gp68 family protein [Candidatus Eisenbacteria bacterium]
MSDHSSIEWTDATWNPVTGCTKISPGCKHCYALTFSERFRGVPGHPFEFGFDLRLWPNRLGLPLTWRTPKRIFVNSMSDLFHERVPDTFIDYVFDTMFKAHWHHFQVLTKRPERMTAYLSARKGKFGNLADEHSHIWLGTSIETQRYVTRAELASTLPSAVRFLSCEPLLGPLDLRHVLGSSAINWVIVGGESGHGARPMDPMWALGIRDQCATAGVAFFFKQWGGRNKKRAGRILEDRTWDQLPAEPLAVSAR